MTKKKAETKADKAKVEPDRDVSQYLVQVTAGTDFVVELPNTWRITFGYVNPAVRDNVGGHQGHCLRVYEGDKLRGVWGNVKGFRDLSIPLARKVERETGSTSWTTDSAGGFERDVKVERDEELVLESGESPFG